jgi:dihydrofolate synthase / folylpolyglutamate synthase
LSDTCDNTLKYIFDRLPMFHRIGAAAYKDNLDNTIALSKLTGNPELQFPSIHIAGTNGKGSVSCTLASILQEAGFKTGLFTSPHLKDFRERIRINGEIIPKSVVVSFMENFKKDFEKIEPSFFELTFAMAMHYFAEEKIEVAVVETGMGGRLDSTNIIKPLLSIITNISYDHMQFLGDTLQKIAEEKAGIIKEDTPILIGKTQTETKKVFSEYSDLLESRIYFADQIYKITEFHPRNEMPFGSDFKISKYGAIFEKKYYCPLSGHYQIENLQTVFAAADILKDYFRIRFDAVSDGISRVTSNTGLKGRWQVAGENPLTIFDIAHNEAGIRLVVEQLKATPHNKLHMVMGFVNDKDISKILSLLPKDATYYFCKPDIPRGLELDILIPEVGKLGLKDQSYTSVKKAYEAALRSAAKEDLVFVGGSTFVVAEVV